jgi:hypothetical protein
MLHNDMTNIDVLLWYAGVYIFFLGFLVTMLKKNS